MIGAILGSAAPGVQIWAKAANQCGGLGGHQVNVFVADDQGDPSVALSETQQMVNSDHVIAFLNDQLVLSMSATLTNYLQQVGVPVIGGDDTSSPWFNSAMLFPQASSVATVAATEVKYAVDHGLEKMAIYSCVEAVPCQTYENDVLADIQSHPGATAAASAKVSLTAPSFISECEQAKSAGAQVLLLGLETTSLERFADDCAQQASYHPQYIGYSLGVQSSVSSDPNLNGLYLATTDFPWSDASVPITQAYQRALTQFAPGFNNGGPASTSWAAGIVAQEAARHLPADKPSAKDMLSGLLTIRNDSFGGATPPLTYTSALPRNPGNCTFEIALQGGKFVTPNGDQQRCA